MFLFVEVMLLSYVVDILGFRLVVLLLDELSMFEFDCVVCSLIEFWEDVVFKWDFLGEGSFGGGFIGGDGLIL